MAGRRLGVVASDRAEWPQGNTLRSQPTASASSRSVPRVRSILASRAELGTRIDDCTASKQILSSQLPGLLRPLVHLGTTQIGLPKVRLGEAGCLVKNHSLKVAAPEGRIVKSGASQIAVFEVRVR